jgi:hypothetical protein
VNQGQQIRQPLVGINSQLAEPGGQAISPLSFGLGFLPLHFGPLSFGLGFLPLHLGPLSFDQGPFLRGG